MSTHRTHPRTQGGFTLVEIIVSMGVVLLLLGPVGAWMILVMKTQGPTATRFSDSSQARLANTYVSRDVGSAELVRTESSSFGDNPSCGTDAGDTVLLQLVDVGTEPIRAVYVSHVDDGVTSVWRRTCKVSDTSVVQRQTEVLRGVEPTTPAPAAVCTPAGEANCRQVTFTATLESGKLINVRAMRRATLDPEHVGTAGNTIPYAVITEVSRGGSRPTFTVVLSSAQSADVDGSIVSRTWGSATGPATAAPDDPSATQATYVFSAPGRYTVSLAVFDGIDTATTSTTIEVLNQSPVLNAAATPPQGNVGDGTPGSGDAFQFHATATDDGDAIASWNWDFGEGADVVSGGGTADPVVHFTNMASRGYREVSLSVTDALGATSVARVTLNLVDSNAPDPTPGSIAVTTDAPPGVLVNVPGKTPRAGTVGPGLPAVTVTFTTPTGGAPAWELRRGPTVIESSSAQVFSHVFGPADAGEWTIALSVDGGPEAATNFRLNAAPVAAFVSPTGGGNAPLPVAFDSRSSSDDGAIVSWSWNFGFFDQWTSMAAGPTQLFPNPGVYTVTLTVTDDEGAQNTKIANVTIGGTPAPPVAGSFTGNTYSFAAIPGAEEYEVRLDVTGGGACLQTSFLSVVPAEVPSVSTAYPSCTVAASHRVRSGGRWSGFSNGVTRP